MTPQRLSGFLLVFLLLTSCNNSTTDQQVPEEWFPYGNLPRAKPDKPLSAALDRVYEGSYGSLEVATNELFSNFKYTSLEGLDYRNGDGTLSRRDATKIIRANGKYYVW